MKRVTLSALWAGFWILVVVFWIAPGQADEVALAPRKGVLLLHNGELISGLITAAGDRYDVNLEDGEIHVGRSHVALVARDAHECYLHKRVRVESGRVQDHLELAEWCLRHSLLDDAEQEIAAARAADATHPKIRLVATRLQLAKENPKAQEPIEPPTRSRPEQELDTVVRNLPAGTMETFTNNIQPMLLNYCTRSGCHGPQSESALRLERIGPNRRAGRKPTQRNLRSALAMIDRVKPEESKLLQAPLRPHGTAKAPIFSDRDQSQYQFLVQWVYQVAGNKAPQEPPSVEERPETLSQIGPHEGPVDAAPSEPAADTSPKGAPAANAPMPNAGDQASGPLPTADENYAAATSVTPEQFRTGRGRGQVAPRSAPKRGAMTDEFVPKDAFDPAIFNRRFFGE